MTGEPIRHIAIVGGGVAGWMAASMLAPVMKSQVAIRVIESANDDVAFGALGTLPSLRALHRLLRIDERDMMCSTQGTFSLGTAFAGWSGPQTSYFRPFGDLGAPLKNIAFHQHWLRTRQPDDFAIDRYSLAALAAASDRFALPSTDLRSPQSTLDYAYHLDEGLYRQYLRNHAQQQRVVRTQAEVAHVRLRENGFIEAIVLANGESIEADLFIDCSGASGLLIEQALKTGFEDWSHWLPCDRVLTVPCEDAGDPQPYMRAVAREAGWQWHIPLQQLAVNGYVYSSRHISDDAAAQTLLSNLDGKALAEPRLSRFMTGRRKRFWVGNCLAVGSAAGCMEPLASTSIHLIQSGLAKLLALFPHRNAIGPEIDEYNRLAIEEFERIRDLLILHYHTNGSTGALWEACRAIAVPRTLQRKLDLFRSCGRVVLYDEETFQESDWVSLMIGQRFMPLRHDLMADTLDDDEVRRQLRRMQSALQVAAQAMPTHRVFLDQYLTRR